MLGPWAKSPLFHVPNGANALISPVQCSINVLLITVQFQPQPPG